MMMSWRTKNDKLCIMILLVISMEILLLQKPYMSTSFYTWDFFHSHNPCQCYMKQTPGDTTVSKEIYKS